MSYNQRKNDKTSTISKLALIVLISAFTVGLRIHHEPCSTDIYDSCHNLPLTKGGVSR